MPSDALPSDAPARRIATLGLHDVSRYFGRRRALARVNLECRSREVLGLLGPNGAGKSTLLSITATLMSPTSGRVVYGSYRLPDDGVAIRRGIGLLGHDLSLYPELTARENLQFFGRLHDLSDLDARVERALDDARLTERADELVSSFSRGMRQRLGLGRAILHDPDLVLLDEPFTGLDDEASSGFLTRLRRLSARGCIVIIATHDLDVVDGVVDRAALLVDGRLRPLAVDGRPLRVAYREALAGGQAVP